MKAILRVTLIDDSRETGRRFLEGVALDMVVELQSISAQPFFDESIEKAISEFRPNLIILDLMLYDDINSGFRVLRSLTNSNVLKRVPVVVCSKYVSNSQEGIRNRTRAEASGAVAVLSKVPFPTFAQFAKYAKVGAQKSNQE